MFFSPPAFRRLREDRKMWISVHWDKHLFFFFNISINIASFDTFLLGAVWQITHKMLINFETNEMKNQTEAQVCHVSQVFQIVATSIVKVDRIILEFDILFVRLCAFVYRRLTSDDDDVELILVENFNKLTWRCWFINNNNK